MNRIYPPLAIVAIVFVQIGCGASQPVLAGRKPTEYWVEALEDKNVSARVAAVKKLGNIGRKNPDALPAVFNALSDSAPAVRKEAIYAVVKNRNASREALPLLEEMMTEDEDAEIRKIAEEAFGNLTDRN